MLLLLLALPAAAAPPLGMVTDVRGDVRRGGARADVLTQLGSGDVLVLAPGATVTVTWFSDGHRERVQGPAKVTVSATGLGGAPVEKVKAAAALAGMQSRTLPGAGRAAKTTRGPSEAVAALPPAARVPATAPQFRVPVEAAFVELQDAGGAILVSEVLTGDEIWAVPRDVALQAGADYRMVARDRQKRVVSSRVFQVVAEDPAVLEELEVLALADPQDATPWIARAGMLEAAGLQELALDAVLEALARSPSPSLLRWAAALSDDLGRPVEARAWRALADDAP